MSSEDLMRLRKQRGFLVKSLIFDEIQDYLYQEDILSSEELEKISAQITKHDKIRTMLDILEKKSKSNRNVIPLFLTVLRNNPIYKWVVPIIENTEIPDNIENTEISGKDKDDVDAPPEVSEEMKKTEVLNVQLSAEFLQLLQQLSEDYNTLTKRQGKMEQKIDQLLGLSLHESKNMLTNNQTPKSKLEDVMNKLGLEANDLQRRPNTSEGTFGASFAQKCLEEFKWKPFVAFSEIERIGCRLGVEVVIYFLEQRNFKEGLNQKLQVKKGLEEEVITTMKRMVAHVITIHSETLTKCLNWLDLADINGYQTIDLLANALFEDDMNVNWGRIITWFAFWGQFWVQFFDSKTDGVVKVEEMLRFYGQFFGFYLGKRLHLWIAGAGGWETFVERYKERQSLLSRIQPFSKLLFNSIP